MGAYLAKDFFLINNSAQLKTRERTNNFQLSIGNNQWLMEKT